MNKTFYDLLIKFSSARFSSTPLTIFDVSGYPHYENVSSNILSFYLNPFNEHGLGDLFLSSLVNLSGEKYSKRPTGVEIFREFTTSGQGKIDILAKSDTHTIGIENKIFHCLNNDLLDYQSTVVNEANNRGTVPILIILSIKRLKNINFYDFKNITYSDLWQEVKSKLGNYSETISSKWLIYLIDFINNTGSLSGGSMDITDQDRFIVENDKSIQRLISARDSFLSKLSQQVVALKELLIDSGDLPKTVDKQWIYSSKCLVHDFILDGNRIAFDLYVSPEGWKLELFGRNMTSAQYLDTLIGSYPEGVPLIEGRFVLKRWGLEANLSEIKDELCKWMDWIVAANLKIRSFRVFRG